MVKVALFDVQVPLPEESLIRQSEPLMVTTPVGVVPEYWGETVTENRSFCSWPKVTLVSESLSEVVVDALGNRQVFAAAVEPTKLRLRG